MKTFLIALSACITFYSCSPTTEKTADKEAPKLDSLLHRYNEERLRLNPIDATTAGDNRFNDLLPNMITADYRKQQADLYSRYKKMLLAYNRADLSEKDKTSYDVLLWECDIALEGLQFKDNLTPINQFYGLNLLIAQLATGESIQPFKTVKDYDNWVHRLESYVIWCDSAIVNMKKGAAIGYVIPKALAKKIIPQLASFDHGPVQDHLFYMPIKNIPPSFSEADKSRLTKAYSAIIENQIIPIHKKFKDFMENEYLPACRESSGIDAIPDGKKYYQYLIKAYTTINLTPEEIFALGKSEVERITEEMNVVKNKVNFKGDLKDFFDHLRNRKELMPYTRPEEVIDNFNAIHERMKPKLAVLFDKTPKTSFKVKRTEAFREATASAEYNVGSEDGSRPGVFYVPIPDVKKYNVLSDEDLFLHEAIPGHHYQISLQQEDATLPQFRRLLIYSAYAEGWALYAESLGKELGLYTDPYQYFGMLSAEMHRAIRLVVDAGIHTQGWTREQAIQYSKDHEAETEEGIIAEIERYMAIPGQALSYKVGQLKIRELRNNAEQALGDKFNIAQFHNQVLGSGCVPLAILEVKINDWINASKSSAAGSH